MTEDIGAVAETAREEPVSALPKEPAYYHHPAACQAQLRGFAFL